MSKKCKKCGCNDLGDLYGDLHQGDCHLNAIGQDSTHDKTGKITFETWAKNIKEDSKIDRTKLKGEKDVIYKQ